MYDLKAWEKPKLFCLMRCCCPLPVGIFRDFLKSLYSCADMAIMGRRRFNARLLTTIVQSAAELKFSDEALLDKLSQNLLSRMDKLDAIEVTDLVTSPTTLLSKQSRVVGYEQSASSFHSQAMQGAS